MSKRKQTQIECKVCGKKTDEYDRNNKKNKNCHHCKNEFNSHIEWAAAKFYKRIGKTIFGTKNNCNCENCKSDYENGIVVANIDHAFFLANSVQYHGRMYYDTKQQITNYENR